MKRTDTLDDLHFQVLKKATTSTDLRRAKILEGVIDILSRQGVDELTFESIGKKVGMARSHVIYYFKNRDELVRAAVLFSALSAHRVITTHMEGTTDWKKLLVKYIEGNFRWVREYPAHATVYALLYYQARLKNDYKKLHTDIREAGARRIEEILELGDLKSKKSKRLAKSIQGLITGNLIDVMTTDNSSKMNERMEETIATIQDWIKNS